MEMVQLFGHIMKRGSCVAAVLFSVEPKTSERFILMLNDSLNNDVSVFIIMCVCFDNQNGPGAAGSEEEGLQSH